MLSWQTSGRLYDEAGNALTVKRAFANVEADSTTTLVNAVAGKKLRILWVFAHCGDSPTTLLFNSLLAAVNTPISSTIANAANGQEVLPFNPFGWLETASGAGLSATVGEGSVTGVMVGYVEVP